MKFKGTLTEAVLLKRYFRFLAEVALKNNKKRMLYCPNLGSLPHCDILGTRIWFSNIGRLSQGYLDVWEITEVDNGWLVDINPGHAGLLVREALEHQTIPELQGFQFLQAPEVSQISKGVELLLKESGEQCFIHIEPIILGDDRREGYFPGEQGEGVNILKDLITLKEIGHRVLLFYCVQHNGIQCIRPNDMVDPLYGKLLREAVTKGVEVLAYRLNINLQELTLGSRIPIMLSEDTISH